jgi:tRNA threonylcarbamoyladenosine dehydratase
MTTTDPTQFYRELTSRNAGFITPTQQDTLRRSTILIAGCGSTGAPVPILRLSKRGGS